eukprot:CAMPEP_0184388784 /NCGR_PEP_ID=MMETSP0007-20130409/11923_1 /TAXON_ID=97485 /ORGANISM="Prymnesium parvum, Strain Texoma1" /LENGTH=69 /DNA_ID=CAMNT_0026737805 /DNA_START=132 /DNA_END=338 /DNA_ORIENTATION=-
MEGGELEPEGDDEVDMDAVGRAGTAAAEGTTSKVPFAFSKCTSVTKSGTSAYRAECGISKNEVSTCPSF